MEGYNYLCDDPVLHIIKRSKAKELGAKHYFTGKPCKRGHITKRFVSDKTCESCRSIGLKRFMQTEKYQNYKKNYYMENKQRFYENGVIWQRENREKINKKSRERSKERYREDHNYKLSCIARNILRRAMDYGVEKEQDVITSLGYTPKELSDAISSKFLDGMSWENHGEWHIDHKTPIVKIISEGIFDPKIINCLDNLIPMWSFDNMSKNGKTLEEWLEERGEDSREYKLYSRYLQ